MSESIQGNSAAGRVVRTSTPANTPATSTNPAAGGAAFHVLLERLETNARELEAQAQSIENPKDLTGAVDRAHASLQDVLSLSDRLVEAFRETLARNQAAAKPDSGPAAGGKS